MPNLKPPVVTTAMAVDYRRRILKAMDYAGIDETVFSPLMTLYLTDNTRADEIIRARQSGLVHAVKLYPAGATTNSDAGVTDLLGRCDAVLEALQAAGMRSEEHTSELQSLMRISYAVFCLNKNKK